VWPHPFGYFCTGYVKQGKTTRDTVAKLCHCNYDSSNTWGVTGNCCIFEDFSGNWIRENTKHAINVVLQLLISIQISADSMSIVVTSSLLPSQNIRFIPNLADFNSVCDPENNFTVKFRFTNSCTEWENHLNVVFCLTAGIFSILTNIIVVVLRGKQIGKRSLRAARMTADCTLIAVILTITTTGDTQYVCLCVLVCIGVAAHLITTSSEDHPLQIPPEDNARPRGSHIMLEGK